MDKVKLSKTMSYILRHHPEDFGLDLNIDGSISTQKLIQALNSKFNDKITENNINDIVRKDEKGRFSFLEDAKKIRANYGHSIDQLELDYEAVIPPEILYHGTARKFKNSILKDGIKPMNRKYTHLSATREEAEKVGQRRDNEPVIFAIQAKKAYENDHDYYKTGKNIYLTDKVPPDYIDVIK